MNPKTKQYIFYLILVIFFLVPKVYYINESYKKEAYTEEKAFHSGGDTAHYLRIAKNIHQFGVYGDNGSGVPNQIATWRPPLWPFVVSTFYYFTSNPLGLIVCKSILEILLLLFAVFIIKKNTRFKPIAVLPFLLFFVEPQYLKYSITFWSESLTAILILLTAICFLFYCHSKKYSISIIVLSALTILCHPISVFFVLTLLIVYGILNLKENPYRVVLHAVVFSILVLIWPIRNYYTFDEGLYLTASQGAVLSKGWNENVVKEFTNAAGDLADETINLKYLSPKYDKGVANSAISKSKKYKAATNTYVKTLSGIDMFKIALVKIKSNFNPFPEKPKVGFVELMSTLFRVLYLFTFLQVLFLLITKRKIIKNTLEHKICLLVLSIIIGQTIMAAYIYTGLRFNSIYGLAILFSFLLLNNQFISKFFQKMSKR
jgi:hypothetical protein